jgi:hypothetical protein
MGIERQIMANSTTIKIIELNERESLEVSKVTQDDGSEQVFIEWLIDDEVAETHGVWSFLDVVEKMQDALYTAIRAS